MKKYIILLLIISFFTTCKAQIRQPQREISQTEHHLSSYRPQNGDYIIDTTNNLDIYVGTWIYNDNLGTIFTLKLERKNQVLCETQNNNYSFYDNIIATYKLEKNNIVLFDNLSAILPNEILSSDEPFGYFGNPSNFNDLDGSFHDVPYNIISECTIKKITTSVGQPEKISFRLYGGRRRNPESFYTGLASAFSIPNNIELTKL